MGKHVEEKGNRLVDPASSGQRHLISEKDLLGIRGSVCQRHIQKTLSFHVRDSSSGVHLCSLCNGCCSELSCCYL